MEKFLQEKYACGYAYREATRILRRLDDFLVQEGLATCAHLTLQLQPAFIAVERSRFNLPTDALFEGEQCIPKRVVMESGICGVKFSRCVDRAVQQFPPSRMFLRVRHFCFPFFAFSSGFVLERKKQIPFIAGSLRTGERAVKGGGVSRLLERSGNP